MPPLKATLVTILLILSEHLAVAQSVQVPDSVYEEVEQMPRLVGTARMQDILPAVSQRLVYPSSAQQTNLEGRVFVTFVVLSTGSVRAIRILKGIQPECDSAVVTAIRQLPQFEPGRQSGKAVAVRLTFPVTFQMEKALPKKHRASLR